MSVLEYIRLANGRVSYNQLIKLGCTKKEAAQIKKILSESEPFDLYNLNSKICTFLRLAGLLE